MQYQYLSLEYLLLSLGKHFDYSILRFLRQCKNQTVKFSQTKLQSRAINLPSTYSGPIL